LGNLPGFQGGVALGPMLKEIFEIPVFINNDGDLFAYGEAIAGFLPYINSRLEKAGSPKRYRNLFGATLGTGFGGGIVSDGKLLIGDNSIAGEVWLLRNKLNPEMNAEEGASIRAVRRTYSEVAMLELDMAPDPKEIFNIGMSKNNDVKQAAAMEAFRRLGEVVGDAMANALTLVDGIGVIGGGISAAWPLFLPSLISELNSFYKNPQGGRFRRLASAAFNLEDPAQMDLFLQGDAREISVPRTQKKITFDPLQRIGIGVSRLGTSKAVAIGAYAFALDKLSAVG
jgi:glucokinase